ncbi:hypothetical protein OE88DRAFT_1737984 [Heliocybe sulcata]|uniref:Wax synthase domain-containing protein n=1 Tax=Heliocybe sulcata TaxID=5364 RepID=A0A5C3MU58_9AGAM|nr:hypothetical protein OE88DRAFT_1737984 [Heliocybe sulcata]
MKVPFSNESSSDYTPLLVDPNGKPPFSPLRNLVLPKAVLILILGLRPRPSVKFACLTVYCLYTVYGLSMTTGDMRRDYSMGSAIMIHVAQALHFVYLTDALVEYRHERDRSDPASLPILKRWWWMLCSVYSFRGVGWNYQVANVPPHPQTPRWAFVFHRLVRAARDYLLVDLAYTYVQSNPYFMSPRPDTSPFTSQGYLFRCINILAWMTIPYCGLKMNYSLLSAACVALGIHEPRHFPDLFGSWSDAYTLRRFWGRTWHQLLRRFLTSIGKYFVNLFCFKKGTNWSSYTQLYVAFIVSGLIHMGGDAMVGKEWLGSSFPFFIAQAFAITFEDAVIAAAKRTVPESLRPWALVKLFGYSWVFLWFSVSAVWCTQWTVDAGILRAPQFSLLQTVLRAVPRTRAWNYGMQIIGVNATLSSM